MNDREKQILYTIISHYIKTGESVGSRTIEKKYDIGVSSATIRNAMADLEDKGFIHKTHTSSGRVPTQEGYKQYIDNIKDDTKLYLENDVDAYIDIKTKQIGLILDNVTEILAKLTNCTAISLEPAIDNQLVKKLEIIYVNDRKAFVVAVSNLGQVRTTNLILNNITSEEVLKEVSKYINNSIASKEFTYTLKDIKKFLDKVGEIDDNFLQENTNKLKICNESSMLLHSQDLLNAIKFLDNKNRIREIFNNILENDEYNLDELNVLFGTDLGIEELENYVVLFTKFEYENQNGIIGIIGPHRMNYKENMRVLNYISDILKQALNNTITLKRLS